MRRLKKTGHKVRHGKFNEHELLLLVFVTIVLLLIVGYGFNILPFPTLK